MLDEQKTYGKDHITKIDIVTTFDEMNTLLNIIYSCGNYKYQIVYNEHYYLHATSTDEDNDDTDDYFVRIICV